MTFLANSSSCLTGIALKRTDFSTTNQFLEAILFVDKHHHFIFIDYEGVDNLISPSQLEVLLKQIENFLVFTIAARGREFHFQREYLLENYLRLTNLYPNLHFCVVAGHPAYKSVDKNLPSTKALQNIFTRISIRNKSNSIIFFGIEKIATHIVQQIIIQYESVIPFLLHGDKRIFALNKQMSPLAVYSPITHSVPDKEAIPSLLGYLYRRKETRQALTRRGYFLFPPINWNDLVPEVRTILYISFVNHVLTQQNYNTRIKSFVKNGVQLVIGYPALPNHFITLVRQFKIDIVHSSTKW